MLINTLIEPLTQVLFVQPFATNKSVFPSLLTSAAATDPGPIPPEANISAAMKVPSPLPSKTITAPSLEQPPSHPLTTRSGLVSPYTSATAREVPGPPESKVTAVLKVPSPFPTSTATAVSPKQVLLTQGWVTTSRSGLTSLFIS